MSKRHLSQQQQRRIKARRQRSEYEADGGDLDTAGLVIARFGKQVLVEDPAGTTIRCHLRSHLDGLVAGDRVLFNLGDDGLGVVTAQQPRMNALSRPDARGKVRAVAANIDLMLVVIAPTPEPYRNLIDRYLVAAELAGIDVALVLNKGDLLTDEHPYRDWLLEYEQLGYTVLTTSDQLSEDAALTDLISGKTLVLVGQSGVGKSSIIGRLLPDLDIKVGALSESVGKGRHTTTAARVFQLPCGSRLIDSPGIREFGLSHISASDVANGFREFHDFLGNCEFRDCQHRSEPGCALHHARDNGLVSAARYDSFERILASLEAN